MKICVYNALRSSKTEHLTASGISKNSTKVFIVRNYIRKTNIPEMKKKRAPNINGPFLALGIYRFAMMCNKTRSRNELNAKIAGILKAAAITALHSHTQSHRVT